MAGDSLMPSRSTAPLAVTNEPEQPQQPEWLRYLSAVRRFGWLVVAVTLAVTGLGVVAAVLMPPSYVAQAIVWIRVPNKEPRNEGPIWQGQLPISSGWMELLQSYAVLDYAVRSRRLYLHPGLPGDSDVLRTLAIKEHVLPGEYRLVVDDTAPRFALFAVSSLDPVARGGAGDSVAPDLGLAWVPPAAALAPGREVTFTLDAPYEATLKLADQLKVSADLDGNFLHMQLGGRDPVAIAATVNTVAERFVAVAAGLKRDNLGELTGILGAQLAQGQAALRSAEDALRAFRGHYTDANPPVRRAAAEAEALGRRTIPALASSLAAELRVRETEVAERVATASTGLQQVPPLAV